MKPGHGFSLIELLVTIVISSIAFSMLVIPFASERVFWKAGESKAESQRNAQLVLQGVARVARQSSGYTIVNGGPAAGNVQFTGVGGTWVFRGGPDPTYSGRLEMRDETDPGNIITSVLIDGNETQVDDFRITQVIPNRLVRLHVEVSHADRETEVLETEVFLRNAS